jgi:hypothetical protein
MFGSGMEGFIVKWTLGIVFAGVVIIFIGKIAILLGMAAKIKIAAFGADHKWIVKLIETLGSSK